MKLQDRVAVVTGGAGGLGRGIVAALVGEGATIVVADIDSAGAEEVAAACRERSPGSMALPVDVTDPQAVDSAFREVVARFGRLDVLVSNAGVSSVADKQAEAEQVGADPAVGDSAAGPAGGGKPAAAAPPPYAVSVATLSDAGWRRMLAVHLDGAFHCIRAAVPTMAHQRSGSIVCTSSIAGLAGLGPFHYAAAKAGLLGLVRSLARDLGPLGIRINAVCPGAIDAGMTLQHPRALAEAFATQIPLGRLGTAADIGFAVLYLASDDSAYTTGQWLSPNGGVVIS